MIHNLRGRSSLATPVLRIRSEQHGTPGIAPVFLETFPNAGVLGVASEDLTWIADGGLTVTGGQCVTTVTIGQGRAEHDTTTDDMFVQIDWAAGAVTNNDISLIGRWGATTPNFYDDDGVVLFVFVNGADVDVAIQGWISTGTVDSTTLTSTSAIATWRLECEGTTARGYRDGVLVVSGSLGALTPGGAAGTRAGLYAETGGAPANAYDNFTFGDL